MPPGDPRADLAVMMHLNGADPTVAWKVCGEPGSVANIRMRAKRERAKRGVTGPLVSNTHQQPEMSPEGMFWTKDGPVPRPSDEELGRDPVQYVQRLLELRDKYETVISQVSISLSAA